MRIINLLKSENTIMDSKEMLSVNGGRNCGCACWYRNVGGSSTNDNMNANYAGGADGLFSPQHKNSQSKYKCDYQGETVVF